VVNHAWLVTPLNLNQVIQTAEEKSRYHAYPKENRWYRPLPV